MGAAPRQGGNCGWGAQWDEQCRRQVKQWWMRRILLTAAAGKRLLCLFSLPSPPLPSTADKYLEYYLHYETYVSSAGHLDFAVRLAACCCAGCWRRQGMC